MAQITKIAALMEAKENTAVLMELTTQIAVKMVEQVRIVLKLITFFKFINTKYFRNY